MSDERIKKARERALAGLKNTETVEESSMLESALEGALQSVEDTFYQIGKGYDQLDDNPVAGATNMLSGLIKVPMLVGIAPFSALDSGLRAVGQEGVADVINAPFELLHSAPGAIAEGVTDVLEDSGMADYIRNAVDIEYAKQGQLPPRIDSEEAQEMKEGINDLTGLLTTVAALKGVHSAKGKLFPKKPKGLKVETPEVKETKLLSEPKVENTTFKVDPQGRAKPVLTETQAKDFAKLETKRGELNDKQAKLNKEVIGLRDRNKELRSAIKEKQGVENAPFRKSALKTIGENQKRTKKINQEIRGIENDIGKIDTQLKKYENYNKVAPEQKQIPQTTTKQPIETTNQPSNINFTSPEQGGKVLVKNPKTGRYNISDKQPEGITPGKALPVKSNDYTAIETKRGVRFLDPKNNNKIISAKEVEKRVAKKKEKTPTQQAVEKIYEMRDIKDNMTSPSEKAGMTRKIKSEVDALRSKGVDATWQNNKLFIDRKLVRKPTEGGAYTKLEDIKSDNPKVTKSFDELGEIEKARQQELAQFVEATDLPRGIGKQKAEKGIQDVLDNAGKEKSPEAQVVREAALEKLEKGHRDRTSGRELTKEEMAELVDESIAKKVSEDVGDTSFEFGANVKKPQVERTKAGEQITFGKIEQPKKGIAEGKIDKSTETPLFEQTKTDTKQGEIFGEIRKKAAIVTDDMFNKSKQNIIDSTKKLNTGFDPTLIKDYAVVGAKYLENVIVSGTKKAQQFGEWSKSMLKDFGQKIKPHLLKIWSGVKKEFGKKILELNDKNPFIKAEQMLAEGSFSEYTRNINKKDYSTLETEYLRSQKGKTVVGKGADALKEIGSDAKSGVKDVSTPMSTVAEKISRPIFIKLREYQYKLGRNKTAMDTKISEYFQAKKATNLSKTDALLFDFALKNGKMDRARQIANQGFRKQFEEILKMKDKLAKELDVKTIENHWFRSVKDPEGFMKYLEETFPDYHKDVFSRLIEERQAKLGRKMSEQEKADLINNALRGYNPGLRLSDVGNMRKRVIPTLDGKLNEFYHTSDLALLKGMTEMLELKHKREFFGNRNFEFEDSIGEMIQALREKKGLDFKGSRELQELMQAHFNPKPITNKTVAALRDLGIVTKLANPFSAMTQLKDLAFSLYLAPFETPKAYAKAWGNKLSKGKLKLEVELKEVGLDPMQIASELADPSMRSKAVNWFLRKSGFSHLDVIGKSTLINAMYYKYMRLAKKKNPGMEFNRRIERYFGTGAEKAKVIADLKAGKKTDSVTFLLFNELSGTQPITLLEMPKNWARGGNFRVMWFLKSFTMRQLDFVMNETVRVARDKNLTGKQRLKGAAETIRLLGTIGLMGATVDQLRAMIYRAMGSEKSSSFTEDFIDNIINVAFLSKYDGQAFDRLGAGGAVADKIIPPIGDPVFNAVEDSYNLLQAKGKNVKSLKNVPIVGRVLYETLKQNNSRRSRRTRRRRPSRRRR